MPENSVVSTSFHFFRFHGYQIILQFALWNVSREGYELALRAAFQKKKFYKSFMEYLQANEMKDDEGFSSQTCDKVDYESLNIV